MESHIFVKEYPVRSYEYGPDEKVTLLSLLNYMQDAAVQHSRERGYSIEQLFQLGITWVLYRLHLIVEKRPLWNETVVVHTWPYALQGLHAIREFHLTDSAGRTFAKASTQWILIDFRKKRPARIPAEMYTAFHHVEKRMVEDDFPRLPRPESETFRKEIPTRRAELDSNGHVNNVWFADWALEALPEDPFGRLGLRSLEVMFKQEARFPETILSVAEVEENHSTETICLHRLFRRSDGSELALVRTIWAPNEI